MSSFVRDGRLSRRSSTLALVLDLIYQVVQLKWIYPLEALVVAFTLAFLPYLLLRGPVNWLARWWRSE